MRSHAERLVIAIAALVMMALTTTAVRATQPLRSSAGTPTEADIHRALDRVRADPNLAGERTIKFLRWRSSGESSKSGPSGLLIWLIGLFRWLEQSARLLVWAAVIALAGFLVVYIARVLRAGRNVAGREDSLILPTHVRELDIRPESLPPNIGAAARALWDRREHRGALALLYRGMLSRLAHVHGVPIRDSSTEGDCLALATGRVPQPTCQYVSRLVRIWQRFGYGHEQVPDAAVHGLCDEFASVLDHAAAASLATRGTA